ncbi:MAG: hypothetical protein ACRD3C_03780 [Vicinamibacterales bacterium]
MMVELLDAALRKAGIPIDGVSISDPLNKASWRIDFAKSATEQQRQQAADLVRTFDPTDPALLDAVAEDLARAQLTLPVQAFHRFWFIKTNGRAPTPEELIADTALLIQCFKDLR